MSSLGEKRDDVVLCSPSTYSIVVQAWMNGIQVSGTLNINHNQLDGFCDAVQVSLTYKACRCYIHICRCM